MTLETGSYCLTNSVNSDEPAGVSQDDSKSQPGTNPNESPSKLPSKPPNTNQVKSIAQADAELREKMERMSGEGGAAGVEYEDGKPSAMKRGVRNNMFRLI